MRPARAIEWGMSLDMQGKKTTETYTIAILGGTPAELPPAVMVVSGAEFVFKRTVQIGEDAHFMLATRSSPWQAAELTLSSVLV